MPGKQKKMQLLAPQARAQLLPAGPGAPSTRGFSRVGVEAGGFCLMGRNAAKRALKKMKHSLYFLRFSH